MKHTEMLKKNYEYRLVLNRGKYYPAKYIEAFAIENKLEINKLRNSSQDKTSGKQ